MRDSWKPLAAVWQEGMGRKRLMRLTGCSSGNAQRFLEWKRGGKPDTPQKEPPPPANKYDFLDTLSHPEVEAIRKSVLSAPAKLAPHFYRWSKASFKFAAIADTHFGHVKASSDWWSRTCDLIAKEKCDMVFHAGDITEGMSSRPGHVYELNAVGVNAQVDLAAQRLGMLPCPIEAITGNHDAFAFKVVGIEIGSILQSRLPNYKHLGSDEADVTVDGIKIKLWHGGDGASYALSYRTQKFIEGLTGGEKPHILLSGHAHKSIFFECRNVMTFECGTLCGQTSWMRGKKLAAHAGFWLVEVWPSGDGGIERISPTWVPFFKEC